MKKNLLILSCLLFLSAHAQTTFFWRTEATDNSWQTSGNWWNGAPAAFGFGIQQWNNNHELNQSNGQAESTYRFTFESGATSGFTFTGSAVSFFDFGGSDPAIINNSSGTHNINMNIDGDGDGADPLLIQINSTGGLNFGGNIANDGAYVNVEGSASSATVVNMTGVVSGSGGLYKTNSNITLNMSGVNTYTGTTDIHQGTLNLQAGGSLVGPIEISLNGSFDLDEDLSVSYVSEEGTGDGGTMDISSGKTLTITGADLGATYMNSISGAGNLTIAASGTTTYNLYGTQSYTGTTTISGGKLSTGVTMSSGAYSVSNGELEFTGDNIIGNSSTLNVTGGAVSLEGSDELGAVTASSGTITIASGKAITMASLSLSGDAALVLEPAATLTISGNLVNNSSTALVLNASSSGYSQLLISGSVSGSGSVTIEQHVQHTGWHNMAFPVSANLSDLGTVNTSIASNTRNVYTWDEASTSWVDVAGATDGSSTASSAGSGYMVYIGTNGVASNATEIDLTGTMTTSVTPSLSNSGTGDDGGWNFIGNPFTCDLDFFALSTSQVANGYSIWNQSSGTYSNVSGFSSGQVGISALQGFWVDATGASPSLGTITMATHGAIGLTSGFLKTQNVVADRFNLNAYPSSSPAIIDNYLVAMVSGATDGRDLQYDMRKRMNAATAPSLMSIDAATGKGLAVNAIDYSPNHSKAKELQMRFAGVDGETYFIELDDALLTNNYHIMLEDLKSRKMHDLNNRPYKFVHNANAEYRFILHLSPVTTVNSGHTHVSVGSGTGINGGTLVFKIDESSSATDGDLFDLTGKRVASFSYPAGTSQYTMNVAHLSSGIYVLKLNSEQGEEVHKVLIP